MIGRKEVDRLRGDIDKIPVPVGFNLVDPPAGEEVIDKGMFVSPIVGVTHSREQLAALGCTNIQDRE